VSEEIAVEFGKSSGLRIYELQIHTLDADRIRISGALRSPNARDVSCCESCFICNAYFYRN